MKPIPSILGIVIIAWAHLLLCLLALSPLILIWMFVVR